MNANGPMIFLLHRRQWRVNVNVLINWRYYDLDIDEIVVAFIINFARPTTNN